MLRGLSTDRETTPETVNPESWILQRSSGEKLGPENPLSEIRSGFNYHNEDPFIIYVENPTGVHDT